MDPPPASPPPLSSQDDFDDTRQLSGTVVHLTKSSSSADIATRATAQEISADTRQLSGTVIYTSASSNQQTRDAPSGTVVYTNSSSNLQNSSNSANDLTRDYPSGTVVFMSPAQLSQAHTAANTSPAQTDISDYASRENRGTVVYAETPVAPYMETPITSTLTLASDSSAQTSPTHSHSTLSPSISEYITKAEAREMIADAVTAVRREMELRFAEEIQARDIRYRLLEAEIEKLKANK